MSDDETLKPDRVILDEDGQPVSMSREAAEHGIQQIIGEGEMIFAVFRWQGQIAVNVMGDLRANEDLPAVLEHTAKSLRTALAIRNATPKPSGRAS